MMEHFLVHLAATAAWVFGIIFVFALIGVYATTRWIVGLFTRTEQAVQSGVANIQKKL
ncbi:MAG: hypothetical protein WA814_04445 [Candidatus Baltobacteraceae bacterium]